jgi:hypothetical protein
MRDNGETLLGRVPHVISCPAQKEFRRLKKEAVEKTIEDLKDLKDVEEVL